MANRKKPLVVVTRKLPDSVETRMRELFDTRLNLDDKPMSQAELAEAAKVADVLVPTVTDRIDASVLSHSGEKLKLIANFGNGVDNIDVATALQRGIPVTNTPGVLTEDTADMTMALILAVPRRLAEGSTVLTSEKDWAGWSPTWMLGHRISGKRLRHTGQGRDRQAAGDHRRGPDRPGGRPPRARLRVADPLSQPPPRGSQDRAGAGGDLLGEPRPDAGPHGHHLGQLSAHARDLSFAVGAPAQADAPRRLYREHGARRGHRRERAHPHAGGGRARGRRPRRVRGGAGREPQALAARARRKSRAAAAHGLGDRRRTRRHGDQGHHQHPDLHGRPPAA